MDCSCDYIMHKESVSEVHYDNCRLQWKDRKTSHPLNNDGTFSLPNPHLAGLDYDVLYHLGIDTKHYNLVTLFGDVKFVCMGGTKNRMKEFAVYMSDILHMKEEKLINLTKHSHRYAMYKIGPVLSISHGIGIPSMTVVLQEIIKLLHYAKTKNTLIFRIGTSGGLDLEPGSVVISSFGVNATLQKYYEMPVLGKIKKLPAFFDKRLSQELLSLSTKEDGFNTVVGGTMAADDFYRGQARLDGPFCDHSVSDKIEFLKQLCDLGVKNIEMESTAFAAFTREAGLRSADVCVTLINRLHGDQLSTSKSVLLEWQKRPMVVVGRYISKYCENNK